MPQMKLTNVTPEMARKWLAMNDNNRVMRPQHVKALATEMRSGKFILNGDVVRLTKAGPNQKLLDGQHRLSAIIESNLTVPTYVCSGIDEEAFKTIDRGLTRGAHDALAIHTKGRMKDTKKISAALRILRIFLMNQGQYLDSKDRSSQLTPDNAIEVYEDHKQIVSNVERAYEFTQILNWSSASVIGGLYTYMELIDETKAQMFWNSFNSGANLPEDSPINALRNYMMGYISRSQGLKPKRRHFIVSVIKAWNMYITGEKCEKFEIDLDDSYQFVS